MLHAGAAAGERRRVGAGALQLRRQPGRGLRRRRQRAPAAGLRPLAVRCKPTANPLKQGRAPAARICQLKRLPSGMCECCPMHGLPSTKALASCCGATERCCFDHSHLSRFAPRPILTWIVKKGSSPSQRWGVWRRMTFQTEFVPIAPALCCKACLSERVHPVNSCADRAMCSGHGVCILGQCECTGGFRGGDCSVCTATGGPTVSIAGYEAVIMQ